MIEMLTVVAICIIMASISFISMVPVMKQHRVTNAYNMTLAAMRQARDNAVSQRTSYSVTFTTDCAAKHDHSGSYTGDGFQGDQNTGAVYQLADGCIVSARIGDSPPLRPRTATEPGRVPIDFGYTANGTAAAEPTAIYFCPDGSAQDAEGGAGNCAGSWDGGVVYIARKGDLLSSRAITLWGGTGRIHGWRLYSNAGEAINGCVNDRRAAEFCSQCSASATQQRADSRCSKS